MPPAYPKILIIEDELIIAADASMQFSKLGYEVIGIHARAADAMKTMAMNRPDIVVLDISLSGNIDGLIAARMIGESYQLPIIFLSASTDRESLQRALAFQPYAFITKPFASRDLQNAIEHTLTRMATPLRVAGPQCSCPLFFCGEVYWLKPLPPLEA